MKALKNIINWTIWSLMALYVLVLVAVHLPVCQEYLGKKVADAIGNKLNTQVSVGRIDLGFLNRIIVDDLHLYDQQKKEMLRVSRLSAKVGVLGLTRGQIAISSVQLFGAHAKLYKQNTTTQPNFQFVLDSLASKDTTSHTPLDLRINSLIMRRSSITYDQLDAPLSAGILNPQHLHIRDISAQVVLKKLTDDSLDVNVKRLGFSEDSGLDINRLAFRLKAGKQNALLQDFSLEMPSTKLQMDSVAATYRFDKGQLDLKSLTYQGSLADSYITPSDLRCIYQPLKNIQRPLYLTTAFSGTGSQITIPQLHIYSEADDVRVKANGFCAFGDDQPAWQIKVDDLSLSDNILDFLQKNISQIPAQVKNIGSLQLAGNLSRLANGSMNGGGQMSTDIGNLEMNFTMAKDQTFSSYLKTGGIDLKTLFGNDQLGQLAADLTLNGQLKQSIQAQGLISTLDYNNYSFSNIGINGSYSQNTFDGYLKVEDPNLSAELEGSMLLDQEQSKARNTHQMNLKGNINRLAPAALHLTDQWGDAVFKANIDADFKAHTLNDAIGSIRISNLMMTDSEHEPYYLDNLMLNSGFDEGIHYLTLISDFAKAELRGDFEYQTLAQSFTNFVGQTLPTLPGLPPVTQNTNNDFSLRLHVYKTDWLQRLLGIGLTVGQPMTLSARVNDPLHIINLESDMPEFSYDGAPYKNGRIRITTPMDTIRCALSVDKLMDNGQTMDIQLNADAVNNQLVTSLTWDNQQTQNRNSGELNLLTSLYRNLEQNPEAHLRVQPSYIVLNDATWSVEPSDIIYASKHLLVDHFMVHNGPQHIIIDGKATQRASDSLIVDLNDVEVAYILDLVNFHSVEFSGQATGKAYVYSLFGDFDGKAKLDVNHFKFENGRMGTLHAKVDWNQEAKQIDIDAIADDGTEAQTFIKGYVSPTYNTIDLGIRAEGTYMDFMHNFTKTFLSDITGHANGAVRLAGPLDNINLTGRLVVDGEATVTSLNTTYTLKNDTVVLIPDDIQLKQMAVYDKYGNRGYLSGGVHHEHLTNLSYDLNVAAENLLAYDFKDFGESTFYGTVYATGDVAIHGRSGEVTIDCNITPEKNSVFVYNASSPDAISNQEFIEWGSASEAKPLRLTGDAVSNGTPADLDDIDIPTDIYINFLINCTPEATIRLLMDKNTNDYITLNGEGTIRATFHNKGPFNMFGTYTVDHGTYGITIQNIIKKNFTFNQGGTIIFGGDPYNAALNLQAVYTVNGVSLSDLNIGNSFASNTIRVNCLMNIGGQPNSPQVDFDLELPTVNADEQQMVRSIINGQQEMNQQVLYLLGIGRFYNQGQNNATTGQQDQTALAMQSFLSGTLSTQINTLLNTVIKNDNWNFGANISTGNEGWHNAEYEGLISGRMLNNRLLLNGQFGYRDNAKSATPSFIGDFDIQYLLYPNGNLALKVYNQTNDRYFTKSSLNTQGIGLIMKKDFNNPRDLFSTKKKRKQKKEKKQ